MNILLSLLLLNPLEAMVIIKGCDLFVGREVSYKDDIRNYYLLGTINLLIQICLCLNRIGVFGLILNILVPIFIGSCITKMYYKYILRVEIKFSITLTIQILYIATTFIIIAICNFVFDNIYTSGYTNICFELLVNLSKTILQVLLITLCAKVKYVYEKVFEKCCKSKC